MESSGTPAETEHEPVAANPYGGTPPWQRRGGWKRGIAGLGALVLTAGSIVGVAWLAFRDTGGETAGAEQVIHERCRVTESDDAAPTVAAPRLDEPADRTVVTIATSHGDIDIMLWGDLAPCGVGAFLHLAETGFYDLHDCDRLTTQNVSPFAVLRCGSPGFDPDSDRAFGPGWRYQTEVGMTGVDVVDALALVTDEQGRAGGAFTIIRGQAVPTAHASVIGAVVDGFEVLDAIAATTPSVVYDGEPPEPVTVYGITVTDESTLPEGEDGTRTSEAPAPDEPSGRETDRAHTPQTGETTPANGAEPS